VKEKVRERCGSHVLHVEVGEVVREVNYVINGWWAYYRHSNASHIFRDVQEFTNTRVRHFLRRRKNRTGLGRNRDCPNRFLYRELGLACIACQGSDRFSDRERLHERGRRAV
jgi:hypothetical protein